MDFDKVYSQNLCKKYPLEKNDSDFRDDTPWADYYIKENVPGNYVENGEEFENLSSITVYITDVDPEWEYEDNSFSEDFGLGPEHCDPGSGYVLEELNCSTEAAFMNDGDEITIEEFAKINGISVEDAKVISEIAEETAEEDYKEWAEDGNLEPPDRY